ncbi:carbonic anhydrase [Xylogone sp. PMI_703]|nr:carbonic anhydrase [Xylogone sp. PMI_703]
MAAPTITVQSLVQRNKEVAEKHQPYPLLEEMKDVLMEQAHILVLTCADPRCAPENMFNLTPQDGIIIFRNAGGHVATELQAIVALDVELRVDDIMIIHHTDCGTSHFTNEQIREALKKDHPNNKEIDTMEFGAITGLEQSVRDDLAILKSYPFIRKELANRARGFVYDLKTGLLTAVRE